jgi:hypothetical protein
MPFVDAIPTFHTLYYSQTIVSVTVVGEHMHHKRIGIEQRFQTALQPGHSYHKRVGTFSKNLVVFCIKH